MRVRARAEEDERRVGGVAVGLVRGRVSVSVRVRVRVRVRVSCWPAWASTLMRPTLVLAALSLG